MAKELEPIKRWSPKHELVVALSIGTMPVKGIAEQTGYSSIRIIQILNDPQAHRIRQAANDRIRAKMMEDIDGGLAVLSGEAVKRIAQTIEYDEFVLGSDAKKHQDNLSLGLLKGTGLLNGDNYRGSEDSSKPPLNERLSVQLIEALEDSNEAERLRQGKKEVIKEAKHELVTEGS